MPRLVKAIDERGAVIEVTVGLTGLRAESRKSRGLPRITPSTFPALIDTGATCSAIEPDVARALQLAPVGFGEVHSTTTGDRAGDRPLFEVRISIAGPGHRVISELLTVVGCDNLAANGYLMLLGRDVLERCEFLYDGPKGEFTLTY